MTQFTRRHATMPDVVGTAGSVPVTTAATRDGLRLHEVSALAAMVARLGRGLMCETERDGAGDLWAIIGPCDPEVSAFTAFLICRQRSRLMLIEAPLTAHWITLGSYGTLRMVVAALLAAIDRTHPAARAGALPPSAPLPTGRGGASHGA